MYILCGLTLLNSESLWTVHSRWPERRGEVHVLIAASKLWRREEMRILLARAPDIQVVGQASDGLEAIEQTLELEPNIVVMDVEMPRLGGVQATERILKLGRKVRVVLVAAPVHGGCLRQAQLSGARACIGRPDLATELIPAIRAASAGTTYYGSSISRAAWAATIKRHSSSIRPPERL